MIKSSSGGITRTVTGEFSAHIVAHRVEHNTQRAQSRANLRARRNVVLTDAACKYQHVESTQLGDIATDPARNGPREFLYRQPRLCVAFLDRLAQIAHVI